MTTNQGDPYAAWAGAEKRLQNAIDTISELRAEITRYELARQEDAKRIDALIEERNKIEVDRHDAWQEIVRLKVELATLKLKARKVVQKKKDADQLGHTSAFARAVNELEPLVKE